MPGTNEPIAATDRCPCGSGERYGECCGRLHDGTARASTAEQLMRSRYSAFVLEDDGYLLRTWHPSTRPRGLRFAGQRWTGLEILARTGGGLFDTGGTVEFRAHSDAGVMRENSRFVRDGGGWLYLDAL